MKINLLVQSEHQPLKPDNSTVAAEKQDKVSSIDATNNNDEHFSSSENRLLVGAKSLMSALSQELKLDDSDGLQSSLKESLSTPTDSGTILNKIDLEPIHFDFAEVARNVMEFINSHIEGAKTDGASDESLEALLAQARAGVEKGFEYARVELDEMGMLSDEVKEGIDSSYDIIEKGINDLDSRLFDSETDLIVDSMSSPGDETQETKQGDITVKTVDGDNINISFNSKIKIEQSHSFNIESEKALSDEKLQDIKRLISGVNELSNQFFSNDLEEAFEQASDLGFDSSQIAQFSLDFTQVKQLSIREHYSPSQSNSPIATISPYIQNLNDVLNHSQSLFSEDSLEQLMQGIARGQLNMMDNSSSKSAEDFSRFNQQLIDAQEKAA